MGSLAILALTLLPPGLSARAQTNAAAYDQDLIAQARAAAAEFPPTNWVLPILVSNSPPFDLMGQYYSMQHVDWKPLPFPPWQNVNAWCLDPTHQIWVYDDRDLDFSGRVLAQTGVGTNIIHQYLYNYDPSGNRTGEQVDTSPVGANFNQLNQMTNQIANGLVQFSGNTSRLLKNPENV